MEAYSKIQFPKENSKDDSYVLGFVCTISTLFVATPIQRTTQIVHNGDGVCGGFMCENLE